MSNEQFRLWPVGDAFKNPEEELNKICDRDRVSEGQFQEMIKEMGVELKWDRAGNQRQL